MFLLPVETASALLFFLLWDYVVFCGGASGEGACLSGRFHGLSGASAEIEKSEMIVLPEEVRSLTSVVTLENPMKSFLVLK